MSDSDLVWVTFFVFGARACALGFNQSLWIYTSLSDVFRVGNRASAWIHNVNGPRWIFACAFAGYFLFAGQVEKVAAVCVVISIVSFLVASARLP